MGYFCTKRRHSPSSARLFAVSGIPALAAGALPYTIPGSGLNLFWLKSEYFNQIEVEHKNSATFGILFVRFGFCKKRLQWVILGRATTAVGH
jgi:hypothetical protein